MLPGIRVLVVEDETAIAMLIEDMLEQLGCTVAVCAASIAEALICAELNTFDVGVLDANVGGHPIDPVAQRLQARRIPFAFITGYGKAGLPEAFRDRPMIRKPFRASDLHAGLVRALGR